jgi:hypothetical protein
LLLARPIARAIIGAVSFANPAGSPRLRSVIRLLLGAGARRADKRLVLVELSGDGELVVRVGAEATDDALARPHTRLFDMTGRPMKGWILVAAEGRPRQARRYAGAGIAPTCCSKPRASQTILRGHQTSSGGWVVALRAIAAQAGLAATSTRTGAQERLLTPRPRRNVPRHRATSRPRLEFDFLALARRAAEPDSAVLEVVDQIIRVRVQRGAVTGA